jgi:uncharacterized membrane protein YkvA (DUF1232 family)
MNVRSLIRNRTRKSARQAARSLIRELPNLLRLVVGLIRDPRVSLLDKLIFGFVLAYTLTPADLVPDILAPLGLVDDLYLLGLSLARLFGRAGADLLLHHWKGDPHSLGYLVEGVDQIGDLLPKPIRRALRSTLPRAG